MGIQVGTSQGFLKEKKGVGNAWICEGRGAHISITDTSQGEGDEY